MKRRAPILFLMIAMLPAGCSHLVVTHALKIGGEDWPQYGGSMERTNVAHTVVIPPLSLAWEYDASAGFSSFSAAIIDSILFVGDLRGEVHAIHIQSGKGVGSYTFGSSIVGTPIIEGGMLYVALTRAEKNLIAYNFLSGKIEWRANLGDIESSPLSIGTRLYVATLEGTLASVDKSTGDIRWQYHVPTHDQAKLIHSSPASDGHTIVFGCDDGKIYAVGIDDGQLRWSTSTRRSIVGSPSIDGGKVFVGSLDSTFYCIDLQTGKALWQSPLAARIFSSQAVGLHHVYVGTAGSMVYCLDEEAGATVWSERTSGVINAAPLLAGSILYVGCTDKTLYGFEANTGKKIWEYKAEGRIKTMPVAARKYLFVLAEDRSVLCFREEEKHK